MGPGAGRLPRHHARPRCTRRWPSSSTTFPASCTCWSPPGPTRRCPLARLRSRGQLVELRAADLRFTAGRGAASSSTTVMGLDLAAADVEALEERTEGWVAGLQLAALSLRGVADECQVAGFIDAFTGSDRFVIDYLADEVLARQPAAVRDFLLRTAVLDRLTGAAVRRRHRPRRRRRDAGGPRARQPVPRPAGRPSAPGTATTTCSPTCCGPACSPSSPTLVPELHQRASDWYARHGLAEDAVRHALAAEDFDRAAYLVEEALPEMRRTRQDGLLLGWLRALPDAVVRRSPVLSVFAGWSLMVSGDLDAAGAPARRRGTRRWPPAPATRASRARGRTPRSCAPRRRPSPSTARRWPRPAATSPGTVRHARRALDLAGPTTTSRAAAAPGSSASPPGRPGTSRDALATFSRGGGAACTPPATWSTSWTARSCSPTCGSPRAGPARARRLYEQALRTATARGEPYPRATADLHVGLAELDREACDDLRAPRHTWRRPRVLGERAVHHREPAPVVRGHGATSRRPGRPRRRARAARPGRAALPARLLPRRPPHRRDEGPSADRRRATCRPRPRGPATEASPSTTTRLPARVRPPHPGPAAARAAPRPHRRTPTQRPARTCSTGCTPRAATPARRAAACSRSACCRPSPTTPAATDRTALASPRAGALAEAPEPDSYVRLFLDEGAPMLSLLRARRRGRPARRATHGAHARRLLDADARRPSRPPGGAAAGRPAERAGAARCCGCSTAS